MHHRSIVSLTILATLAGGTAYARNKAAGKWKLVKGPALQQACDGSDQRACTTLAEYKSYGMFGVGKDEAGAEALLTAACKADVGRACGKLGEYLAYHADRAQAMTIYEKACSLGDGNGCWKRLDINDNGKGEYLTSEDKQVWIEKSYKAYKSACEAGDQVECTEMATGMMSASDLGYDSWFSSDLPAAAKLFDKACKAGWPEACRQLGGSYEGGYGLPQSDKKAKTFYTKACKAGSTDACDNLTTLVEDRLSRGIRI